MTKHFPNAQGSPADLELIESLYAEAKALDARGLFDKAKGYYNACMSLILSKRVILKKEVA